MTFFFSESVAQGNKDAEAFESEQQSKLKTVYQQLQEKTKQLEDAEAEIAELEKDLRRVEKRVHELETVEISLLDVLRRQRSTSSENENNVPSRKEESSTKDGGTEREEIMLQGFLKALKEVDDTGYDKAVIRRLLRTHSEIIADGVTSAFQDKYQQLQQQHDVMKKQFVPVQMELAKHKILAEEYFEKKILDAILKLVQSSSITVKAGTAYVFYL